MNLFIDDGGVMTDGSLRPAQWQALVGEFFAARFGGDASAWSEANRIEIPALFQRFPFLQEGVKDFDEFRRAYLIAWLGVMCRRVGIPAPADEDECEAIAAEASRYITERVRAAYPGAADALRSLAAAGCSLHTASGTVSYELDGSLRGMGVRDLFRRLYGPDLVQVAKGSPAFYERIFADAGVEPRSAVVVDNELKALGWAAEVGAKTVLVARTHPADGSRDLVIGSLAELPSVLGKLL